MGENTSAAGTWNSASTKSKSPRTISSFTCSCDSYLTCCSWQPEHSPKYLHFAWVRCGLARTTDTMEASVWVGNTVPIFTINSSSGRPMGTTTGCSVVSKFTAVTPFCCPSVAGGRSFAPAKKSFSALCFGFLFLFLVLTDGHSVCAIRLRKWAV